MAKPRLLIPIIQHFTVRYAIRTGLLEMISDKVKPIILLNWRCNELENELMRKGIEVHILPPFKYGRLFSHWKSRVDFAHRLKIKSPTTGIDYRRKLSILPLKNKIEKLVRDGYLLIDSMVIRNFKDTIELQEKAFFNDTNWKEIWKEFDDLRPDAILSITPTWLEEEPLLRYAHNRKLVTITAILSFDNITAHGRIPIIFDNYCVWNKYNAEEIKRIYLNASSSSIIVTGPPQFDFYTKSELVIPESIWREKRGIELKRPLILFAGGPRSIAPIESRWLLHIDNAISSGDIDSKTLILLRLHPNDTLARWKSTITKCTNVVVDDIWQAGVNGGKTDITTSDISNLVSTIKHCQVHINTSSTMTVDGAFFYRPQIGPAYDDSIFRRYNRVMRELYYREHFLPITNSGGLIVAHSRRQLIDSISSALQNPERYRAGLEKIVTEICTYRDGKSTLRLSNAIKNIL